MRVLVIVAGGLHLGYVGCYGNDWVSTPALDQLAAEGVVFDQHYADCPSVGGARRAWRNGRYGLPGSEVEAPQPWDGSIDLLALLREEAITTHLVVDPTWALPANFAAGWDHVTLVPAASPAETPLHRTLEAAARVRAGYASLDQWLLWIELPPLLPPWEIPSEFFDQFSLQKPDYDEEESTDSRSRPAAPLLDPAVGLLPLTDDTTFGRLQFTYGAAVAYLDSGLERLFDELRQGDWIDDVLILLTTDRGLALGEHGVVGEYRPWLHDELIHVPLIVRLPRAAEAGRRIAGLSQSVDLMPTLLDLFGLPIPASVHGRSLRPLMRGEVSEVRAYACAGLRTGDAVEWALRTPHWGFLLPLHPATEESPRSRQLYVKPDDRWEVNNVIQHHLELADHFQQVLFAFASAMRRPGPLQPPMLRDVEAQLAAAGPATEATPTQHRPPRRLE
jgi:arylsulfatase A-like enzyme